MEQDESKQLGQDKHLNTKTTIFEFRNTGLRLALRAWGYDETKKRGEADVSNLKSWSLKIQKNQSRGAEVRKHQTEGNSEPLNVVILD